MRVPSSTVSSGRFGSVSLPSLDVLLPVILDCLFGVCQRLFEVLSGQRSFRFALAMKDVPMSLAVRAVASSHGTPLACVLDFQLDYVTQYGTAIDLVAYSVPDV